MPEDNLALIPEAFSATLIAGIIRATQPRAVTETEAQMTRRAAAIIDMFKDFDPATTVEAMTASHCVTLHFQLHDAMMMVPDVTGDEKAERQLWARIRFLTGALRGWIRELKTLQKQHAAEGHAPPPAAEARPHRSPAPASPARHSPLRPNGLTAHEAPRAAQTTVAPPRPEPAPTMPAAPIPA